MRYHETHDGFDLWDITWFFIALAVGLAFSLPDSRAESAFGTVSGKVTDPDYTPIAGARVRVIRADHVVLTAKTDASGDYSIDDVPPGKNDLLVESAGYKTAAPHAVTVKAGDTVWVNPTMTSTSKANSPDPE